MEKGGRGQGTACVPVSLSVAEVTCCGRRLHEKLSSPSRMTPEQARQKQAARQSVAELNRDKTVMERKQKVRS